MGLRQTWGIVYVVVGFVLLAMARPLEFQGDLMLEPADRLLFHGLALVFTLGALGSFLRGAWVFGRSILDRLRPH